MGELEATDPPLERPGEGALLVAEDLALEQRLRNGGAVDGDERIAMTGRQLVERARRQLLAGAALAREQDGRGRGRRQLEQAEHLPHDRARPHELSVTPDLLQGPPEERHFPRGLRLLQRLLDQDPEAGDIERLRQVIVGPLLKGGDGGLDRRVPGQDDDRGERQLVLERAEESEPVEPRHDEIAHDHAGQERPRLLERRPAVGGLVDQVAPLRQELPQPLPRRLVVDDQDPL